MAVLFELKVYFLTEDHTFLYMFQNDLKITLPSG